jgi:hypothetical protein
LNDFAAGWQAGHPLTAAGALAGALLWEEQFLALPADALIWQTYTAASCTMGRYLEADGADSALRSSHAAMHAAAAHGPANAVYAQARASFLALLVERARAEENPNRAAATDAPAAVSGSGAPVAASRG